MPYHFEKGYWLDLLERFANGPFDQVTQTLAALRAGEPLRDSVFLQHPDLRHDPVFGSDPVNHISADWFGRYERVRDGKEFDYLRGELGFEDQLMAMFDGAAGQTVAQAIASEYHDDLGRVRAVALAAVESGLDQPFPSTGFWHNYFGDVEAILRATFILTLETALDIGPEDPVETADPARRLPIEFLWKCPQRWFEGWVVWRDVEVGGGVVTCMLATPGSGTQVITSPSSPEEARTAPDSRGEREVPRAQGASPPAVRRRSPRGMRVVSHASHVLLPPILASRPLPSGRWAIPDFGPTYVGVGDITIAAPAKRHGGVDGDVLAVLEEV
jgi:hypothetical protein